MCTMYVQKCYVFSDRMISDYAIISDDRIYRIEFSVSVLQNHRNFLVYIGFRIYRIHFAVDFNPRFTKLLGPEFPIRRNEVSLGRRFTNAKFHEEKQMLNSMKIWEFSFGKIEDSLNQRFF